MRVCRRNGSLKNAAKMCSHRGFVGVRHGIHLATGEGGRKQGVCRSRKKSRTQRPLRLFLAGSDAGTTLFFPSPRTGRLDRNAFSEHDGDAAIVTLLRRGSRTGDLKTMPLLHDDRLFPADPTTRSIARRLFATVRNLPIVSPHGHTQAGWFTSNDPFPDPAKLFIQPDHYVHRMLYSQGIKLEDLEIGKAVIENPRRVWKLFADHYYLFRGTPHGCGWTTPFRSSSA